MKGRKTVLRRLGKRVEEFKDYYLSHGENSKKTAIFFRISPPTLRKYLRKAGVKPKHHGAMPDPKKGFIPERAKFFKWLQENKDYKLPRSIKKISVDSGIDYATIKMYLYRRKNKLLKWLQNQGGLDESLTVLKDLHGRTVPCRALKDFTLSIDTFGSVVTISARLKATDGLMLFRLSLSNYLQELRSLGKLETPQSPFELGQ